MTHTMKLIVFSICMLLLFGTAWAASSRGWGYAGYGTQRNESGHYYGYRSPSFFYFGGARYYPTSSTRSGSVGGPGSSGLGPGSGK